MALKKLVLFLLLLLVKNVFLHNNDTKDYKTRLANVNGGKYPFFVRVELPLEIRAALYALKNSISHLQETKREIIEEVENALEKKLKVYDLELKRQFAQTKQEIIVETDQNVEQRLKETKNEIIVQMNALEESSKIAVSKSDNLISEIKSSIKEEFQEMIANTFSGLDEIKNQLNSIEETEHNVKQQLIEPNNENILQKLTEAKVEMTDTINALSELTESYHSKTEKGIAELQSDIQNLFKEIKGEVKLSGDFSEIKKQLTKTQNEILTEIEECKILPDDCKDVQRRGYNTSGIYRIRAILSLRSFLVWCDMLTRGGGWTYVINRFDGSQNFYRNWTEYKQGFGNLSREHWLGLDHLYELTNSKSTELLFELIDWDLKTVHALYDNFKIGHESESYRVNSLGSYSGDAGNSFSEHYHAQFSTTDNEHSDKCASSREGGWWYTSCYGAYLTGKYIHNPVPENYYSAIKWKGFHGWRYSLKEARMMIRPRYL